MYEKPSAADAPFLFFSSKKTIIILSRALSLSLCLSLLPMASPYSEEEADREYFSALRRPGDLAEIENTTIFEAFGIEQPEHHVQVAFPDGFSGDHPDFHCASFVPSHPNNRGRACSVERRGVLIDL
jgi:hypothetical protein